MSAACSTHLLKLVFKLCLCFKETMCTTHVRLKFMLMESATAFAAVHLRFTLSVGGFAHPDYAEGLGGEGGQVAPRAAGSRLLGLVAQLVLPGALAAQGRDPGGARHHPRGQVVPVLQAVVPPWAGGWQLVLHRALALTLSLPLQQRQQGWV